MDDVNINFCTIITQSFSYFYHFTLKLCIVLKYAPNGRNNFGGKLAEVTQNCHSLKMISLLRFLKFFAVFSAFSLNIDELKALNAAKI